MRTIIFALPLLMLGACQSISGGTFCDLARTHRFEDATVDAMTDREVQQEEAHNEKVAALCGRKPSEKETRP